MATVTIAQGTLKGGLSRTENGFEYLQYLGIPYAKPPVGKLRFRSPQSPQPWEGERDATTTDSSIISCQMDSGSGSVMGSEDCLYLNVYTPKLPVSNSELRAVLVLFHGGGFIGGNGTMKSENGPDYLIENNVIVVTINYRLGALGFLCLRITEASGNMGIKDQIKALEWIQNNIDKFGGNKDNVTICGVSAGSASCEFLLLAPRAKGLFHKCVMESGSTLNPWAINNPQKAKIMAEKLAQELGYEGSNEEVYDILRILLEAEASDLISKAFQITGEDATGRLFFGFVPVIEKLFDFGDPILTDIPYRLLTEGKFNKVPVIRGFCNKKGMLVSAINPNAIKKLMNSKQFTEFWPHGFENIDAPKYNTKLTTAYIDNAKPNDDPQDFALKFFGDLYVISGVYLAGKLISKQMPIYMYQFSYDGNLNMFKTLFKLVGEGAAHVDETGYLIRNADLDPQAIDDTDRLMIKRMTKMWTNFAKTGNPTPEEDEDLPAQWPLFTEEDASYLNIDTNFTIETNYEPEKMAIFEEIMYKYNARYMSCPCYDSAAPKDKK